MEEELYTVKKTRITKIEDNATYQKYSGTPIKDVPIDEADVLLKLFLNKAAINMGKDAYDKPDATRESILEFIYHRFGDLPVSYIGSAIIKGSLGSYGPGRLVPNSVFKWIGEVKMEYDRVRKHEELEAIPTGKTFDLLNYPVGKAICLKIDWYNAGLMTIDDWDKVDLKVLAEMLCRGEIPTTRDFGIKN
jgi:hypothetical protein